MTISFAAVKRGQKDAGGLTRQERVILQAIADGVANGSPPTLRELAPLLGSTTSASVAWHVRRLVARALLEHRPRLARSIRVTPAGIAALVVGDT